MSKRKLEVVKRGIQPAEYQPIDLTEVKSYLVGVTFEGAKGGYHIPPADRAIIFNAFMRWDPDGISAKLKRTLAHCAYWELFDEQNR